MVDGLENPLYQLSINRQLLPAYQAHKAKWQACTACPLHGSFQKIFYRGVLPADILFIGDAPSSDDNVNGLPFTAELGLILDEIINDSISEANTVLALTASPRKPLKYCLTNALLCHPEDKEDATRACIMACAPRLTEFIKLCRPQLIVSVGKLADTAYLHQLAHMTNIIRSVAIRAPGYIIRRKEDRDQEICRAVAALRASIFNVFKIGSPPPLSSETCNEEDIPF